MTMEKYIKFYIAYKTLVIKEVNVLIKNWIQSIISPSISALLFMLVLSTFIGQDIIHVKGISYSSFVFPGLILMSIMTASFSSSANSLFLARFERNLEELQVAPMPNVLIILSYISGSIMRAIIVLIFTIIFTKILIPLHIEFITLMIFITILAAVFFSLIGIVVALYSRNFNDLSFAQTFILMPIFYFSGIFFSFTGLTFIKKKILLLNPIFHFANIFRYSIINYADFSVVVGLIFIIIIIAILFWLVSYLFSELESL